MLDCKSLETKLNNQANTMLLHLHQAVYRGWSMDCGLGIEPSMNPSLVLASNDIKTALLQVL